MIMTIMKIVPTSFHFMSRFLKAAGADKTLELMTGFLVRDCDSDNYDTFKIKSSYVSLLASPNSK